jgi:hypothetical protein
MSFTLSFAWSPEKPWGSMRSGVSLHSHTSVSRESIGILFEHGARNPVVAWVLRRENERYLRKFGKPLAFDRSYWTSPVTPHQALDIESKQITSAFGLHPMVSITDHDQIEANKLLQLIEEKDDIPISVEWTVPVEDTFFHFGIHNLPKAEADELHRQMQAFRGNPEVSRLQALLEHLHSMRDVIIILNHPLWDEASRGQAHHEAVLGRLLANVRPWVHALELNGLRTWKENQRVVKFAESQGLIAVAGGDRHGFEPNALINVTMAETFAGFAEEIRAGHSHVVLMPQYRENRKLRCFQTAWDMLSEHPDHPYGKVTCLDRSYFIRDCGEHVTITSLFPGRTPPILQKVLWAVRLLESPRLRPALRVALSDGEGLPS